jgi:hypothetical protein
VTDLFSPIDEDRRRRLRALGWHEAAGVFHGALMWRSPSGVVLTEEEAFRRLEREEQQEG